MQVNFTINIDDKLLERIKKFFTRRYTIAVVFTCIFAVSAMVYAATVDKPWTFNNGDIIDAGKINDNFDELYSAVNLLQGNNSGFQPGMIMAYINKEALPDGWFLCDGSTFNAAEYPKLATALGGNILPDLRGRVVIGKLDMDDYRTPGSVSSITDKRNVFEYDWAKTLGKSFDGEVIHKITVDELPKHFHTVADYFLDLPYFTKIKIKESGFDEIEGIVKNGTGTGSLTTLDYDDRTTQDYTTPNNPIPITPPAMALYYIIKHD